MRGLRHVGLLAACDDSQLLGFPLAPDQRRRLEHVDAGPRQHLWCVGRRGLKTTSMALVGLWCCLLRPELLERLRPGERGYAVGVATNLRQARLMTAAARSIVERSPLLAPLVESYTEDEIVFANGAAFAAFPSSSRGGRGWPIFCLLLDEVAHFLDTEGNSSAEAVVRALVPATAQFGDLARIILSSTPWGAAGLFAETFQRAQSGELEDAVAHHATTAQANPWISPDFLAAEERRDPEAFRSEYLAEFVGSGGAFFEPDNVAASVTLPGELRPDDATRWIAGLDPGFSSDPFGLALVGREKGEPRRLLTGSSVVLPRIGGSHCDHAQALAIAVFEHD